MTEQMQQSRDHADAIVVGHDGSTHETRTLETAVALAEALSARLVIAQAWRSDGDFSMDHHGDGSETAPADQVRNELVKACGPALDGHPALQVDYRVEQGEVADVLLRLSEAARMLVVGSGRVGNLEGLLFGSIALQCLHHAWCPVMLVSEDQTQAVADVEPDQVHDPTKLPHLQPGSILAGHDGSTDSDRAVRAAVEVARAFDLPLAVVRCWTIDTMPRGLLWKDGYVVPFDQASEAVGVQLKADIDSIIEQHPDVGIDCYGVFGDPREVLVHLARDASFLTVGSRGRGGFRTLLLGSVSAYCAQRAHCPTLVMPHHPHTGIESARARMSGEPFTV